MGRARLFESNAERQAAYRRRVADRLARAGTDQLAGRLADLEHQLAATDQRAGRAETRAAQAEARAGQAERRAAAAAEQARTDGSDPAQVASMRAVIAELARRLDIAEAAAPAVSVPAEGAVSGPPPMSRAERRAAQREQRHRRH